MKANSPALPQADTVIPPPLLLGSAALLALLTASCCVLPIALSIIGLGGSWLAVLGPFVAYRLPILAGLALLLGWSWFSILRPTACRARRRIAMRYASVATGAFLVSATEPLWQESVQSAMWSLWAALG